MRNLCVAWILTILCFGCAQQQSSEAPAISPEQMAIESAEWSRNANDPQLLAALNHSDAAIRARAILALGRIQDAASIPLLVLKLQDEDLEVQKPAIFALGQMGVHSGGKTSTEATYALTTMFNNPETPSSLRPCIVQALGKQVATGFEDELATLLSDADPQVREEAAHALMRFRFIPTWRGESIDPPEWSDQASGALIQALKDSDPEVRAAVAHALSRYPWPPALQALANTSSDDNPYVRIWGVRGVGRAGTSENAESILWGLEDDHAGVRSEAIQAFVNLASAHLLPSSLHTDPNASVRTAYARALGTLGNAPSLVSQNIKWIEALLKDASLIVRGTALQSLVQMDEARAVVMIEQWLSSEEPLERQAAIQAAAQLSMDYNDSLSEFIDDPHPLVAASAVQAINYENPEAVPYLELALADPRLAVRGTAAQLLVNIPEDQRLPYVKDSYKKSKGDDWVEVRETLVRVLASDQSRPDAIEFLLKVAKEDSQGSVRNIATAQLTRWNVELPTSALTTPKTTYNPETIERFSTNPVVMIETDHGTLEVELFAEEAPLHVAKIVSLVRERFYDGLSFHRVVPNFVIQGGDPTGTGWGGPGWTLPDEINMQPYLRGTLGMPKSGKDTGGSQWFFTHLPTPHLDGNYTVFGQITDGHEIVDAIEIGDKIITARMAS